jgi:hypothetical protein
MFLHAIVSLLSDHVSNFVCFIVALLEVLIVKVDLDILLLLKTHLT